MGIDSRLSLLQAWIHGSLEWHNAAIKVASADASFRRYFRVIHQGKSYIAMDAPPEKEDVRPFIDITQRLLATGVHVPEIIEQDGEQGFLLMEDLGTTPYLDILDHQTAQSLYQDAMQALITMQKANTQDLPTYNADLLLQEMLLMPEWFLQAHLGITLTQEQIETINKTFSQLTTAIAQQPFGFVHRDYHSRNLMQTSINNPGIIDYQDAVYGPLSYDLVSLLRDCYISWPQSQVSKWCLSYKRLAEQAGLLDGIQDDDFLRHVDLMGLQRHIKVLGIFARLNHRDGKEHYLNDLPLTLSYVLEIGQKHPETQAMVDMFHDLKIPQRIGTVTIPE